MKHDERTLDLPQAVAAWRAARIDDLERALEDDLADHLSGLAEDACESGGWPDDESVEVTLKALTEAELSAEVTIYFTELIASSCKDMPHEEAREQRLVLTVRAGETVGTIGYAPSDPSQWDLLDRNSAADGR